MNDTSLFKNLTRTYLSGALVGTTQLAAAFQTQLPFLTATLLALNITGFILMGIDKNAARRQQIRVPERVFIAMSVIGAGAGILTGATMFRHKIRKKYFFTIVVTLTALHLLLIGSTLE